MEKKHSERRMALAYTQGARTYTTTTCFERLYEDIDSLLYIKISYPVILFDIDSRLADFCLLVHND